MSVTLTMSNDQAKALTWLIGSVTSGVNESLNLNVIYDRLHDQFGYVNVTGVERSEHGCWRLKRSGVGAKIVADSQPDYHIDVT